MPNEKLKLKKFIYFFIYLRKLPKSISYLLLNEITERYSLYGMRSILIAFMIQKLYFTNSHSLLIFHSFIVLCYFFSVFGGIIGDKYWDKKYEILLFLSIFYIFGHVILGFYGDKEGLYIGLIIIAICTGLIKPIIVSFIGDQFTLPQEQNKYGIAMNLMFFAVNIGSTMAMLASPYLFNKYGRGLAFSVPSIAMALSLIFFVAGKKYYKVQSEKLLIVQKIIKKLNFNKIIIIGGIFCSLSIFFMLFDQMFSIVVLQALKMDRKVFGYTILPEQISIINPLLIIIVSPLFNYLYKIIDNRGYKINIATKIKIGMIIASLAFIVLAIIENYINKDLILSIKLQILPFILITIAEVLIMPSSAEFAYSVAPHWAKCRSISFFFLSICLGNILNILIFSIIKNRYLIFMGSAILGILSFLSLWILFALYNKDK